MTRGERIKQLRKELGMTQTELGKALGVTKGTVSTWETNNRVPSFETLDNMCALFHRNMDYIMGHSDDATPRITNDEDTVEIPALSEVEDDLTEYALKYARLDFFGREAVEAVIRAEYNRCRNQNELCPAAAYSCRITISREAK